MKITLSVQEDKEMRDYVKDLIRGQVVSVVRGEIIEIAKDEICRKLENTGTEIIQLWVKQAITNATREYIDENFNKSKLVQYHIRPKVESGVSRLIQDVDLESMVNKECSNIVRSTIRANLHKLLDTK